jgi:hypothetical protein
MDDAHRVRVVGPLEPYAAGIAAELTRLGYTLFSAREQWGLVAQLSRWLAGEGLDASMLTPVVVARFLVARRHPTGPGDTVETSRPGTGHLPHRTRTRRPDSQPGPHHPDRSPRPRPDPAGRPDRATGLRTDLADLRRRALRCRRARQLPRQGPQRPHHPAHH